MNQTLSKPQTVEQLDAKAGCPALPGSALFVPLMTRYYEAFERGDKTEELRLYGPRWNETTCRVGREVTLSKGYGKKNRLHGRIWKFKRQHGSTFGSTYKAAILDRYKTLDVWIACISVNLFTACGGCGTQNPHNRCIGCFHPFEPNDERSNREL